MLGPAGVLHKEWVLVSMVSRCPAQGVGPGIHGVKVSWYPWCQGVLHKEWVLVSMVSRCPAQGVGPGIHGVKASCTRSVSWYPWCQGVLHKEWVLVSRRPAQGVGVSEGDSLAYFLLPYVNLLF